MRRHLIARLLGGRRTERPRLRRAHRLFADGEYLEAAEMFEQLGETAAARERARAPYLFLQAGRARLRANQAERGAVLIQDSLRLLAEQGRFAEVSRIGRLTADDLRVKGLPELADQIDQAVKTLLGDHKILADPQPKMGPVRHPSLPVTCPSCGGPVYSKEIEWVDQVTAICNYCGTPMRGDEF